MVILEGYLENAFRQEAKYRLDNMGVTVPDEVVKRIADDLVNNHDDMWEMINQRINEVSAGIIKDYIEKEA